MGAGIENKIKNSRSAAERDEMKVRAIDTTTQKLVNEQANAKVRSMLPYIVRICLVGIGLALGDVYGFRRKRLSRIAPLAQEYMTKTIEQYLADDVVREKIDRDFTALF